MAVPQLSNDASTPFLRELQSKGFTSWYTFDFSDPKAFFKALGCGTISHFGMNYTKVQSYYEKTWIPKVKPLMAVEEKHARLGGGRFSNEEFWRDLGLACSQLCINHFINVGKQEQADIVRKGGCPDKENNLAYKAMASFFLLCLVYYEQTSHGILTHAFYNDETRNEISLFVNIAQDCQRLYLLFHQDFSCNAVVAEPRFPFYMLMGVSQGPILIGDKKAGAASEAKPSEGVEELVKLLLGVVEAQSKVIAKECRYLSMESVPAHNELKEKVKQSNSLMKVLKVATGLDSESMNTVLNLQASKQAPVVERPEHTIFTCFQYPELDRLLNFHFHSFHETCLGQYIRQLNLQYPQKPKCPLCPDMELPETALDACPELKQAYDYYRRETMHVGSASTYTASSTRAAYSGFSQTIPNSSSELYQCIYCGNSCTREHFLTHGCYLCVACGRKAYYENGASCYICNAQFQNNDLEAIQYYNMQLSWYYQQQG